MPTDHFQALRQQMMTDGSLYQLPYVSALNMSIGALATIDQTLTHQGSKSIPVMVC